MSHEPTKSILKNLAKDDAMTQHTNTPWCFASTGINMQNNCQGYGIAEKGKPNLIAGIFDDVRGGKKIAEANAAFIVLAVNSHQRLIDQNKRLTECLHRYAYPGKFENSPSDEELEAKSRALIAETQHDGRVVRGDFEGGWEMTQELLPCPFCGGKARYVKEEDEQSVNHGGEYICCENCGCSTMISFPLKESVREKVIGWWNTRASHAIDKALIAELCGTVEDFVGIYQEQYDRAQALRIVLSPHDKKAREFIDARLEKARAILAKAKAGDA